MAMGVDPHGVMMHPPQASQEPVGLWVGPAL
jgi:hypothetical protein